MERQNSCALHVKQTRGGAWPVCRYQRHFGEGWRSPQCPLIPTLVQSARPDIGLSTTRSSDATPRSLGAKPVVVFCCKVDTIPDVTLICQELAHGRREKNIAQTQHHHYHVINITITITNIEAYYQHQHRPQHEIKINTNVNNSRLVCIWVLHFIHFSSRSFSQSWCCLFSDKEQLLELGNLLNFFAQHI